MSTSRATLIACLSALWLPVAAFAQTPAPATPQPGSRFWVAAGSGFAAARAGCATCDQAGVFTTSRSLVIDAGVRINPRVDAGLELLWVSLKLDGNDPIRTTFVLAMAQIKPWANKGLFVRSGMGIGIAGNGLWSPIGPPLAPPYTTNALAIAYGTGWVFEGSRRWSIQVHAMQYVAALGELTTIDGLSMKNVVGNYWIIGTALVIR